jgi:hypothetical protein
MTLEIAGLECGFAHSRGDLYIRSCSPVPATISARGYFLPIIEAISSTTYSLFSGYGSDP